MSILDKNEFSVLSLGGGTPCYFDNMEIINKKTNLTFFLNLDSQILVERLFTRREKRPLLASINKKSEMKDYVNKHLFERKIYYLKATHIINLREKNVRDTCDKILSLLEKDSP
jgi:shikimate kinase